MRRRDAEVAANQDAVDERDQDNQRQAAVGNAVPDIDRPSRRQHASNPKPITAAYPASARIIAKKMANETSTTPEGSQLQYPGVM